MKILGRIAGVVVLGSSFLGATALMTGTGASVGSAPVQAAEEHEHHPHLHHAIKELREARHELKDADHDFGGHREDAIKAIDVAIEQLETALKYDRK